MAGKEKWFGGCFSFLSAGQPGVILVWVPGAAFHLPTHRFAHTHSLQKAICLFKQILHKKDWRSIIWGYFQPYLWSTLTWSHSEAKAGAAIILPPCARSLLLMFSWSDPSAAATAIVGDNSSWQKPRDPALEKCTKHHHILSSIQSVLSARELIL